MIINNNNYSRQTFTSDPYEEMQLAKLRYQLNIELQRKMEIERQRMLEYQRELAHQKELERQEKVRKENLKNEITELNNSLEATLNYQGLSDPLCDNMAAFMLNFSCSMLMNSEHDLQEFFGTEEEAKSLQENLSPECKKTSQNIRSEIVKLRMSEDPVFGLITVNKLKEYMPEEGILTDEQYNAIANTSKFACTSLVKKSDRTNFDDDENDEINALVNIVENTEGLDFGEEYEERLTKLIDKLNNKNKVKLNESKYTKTFIPPVVTRYIEPEQEYEQDERERERELECE